jgi:ParB-like nuclease domain
MPARCTEGMKRDAVYKCYPEEIEIRPELNGRHDKPDIEWLIADILKRGQKQPVEIWDDAGQAVLSYGFSRWRAISEINKRKLTPEKMQIKCVYCKCNEQQAFINNICENRMRNPTSELDDAHNIQRLFEWGMDEVEVSKIYFPIAVTEDELKEAVKWVRERNNLVKLTPEAQKAMRDGRLNETAAQAIAKLSSAQQREALKANDGKIKAKDIKALAPKSTRGRKPAPAKAAAIDVELRRRIMVVINSGNWEDFDETKSEYIDVSASALAALRNYIDTPSASPTL